MAFEVSRTYICSYADKYTYVMPVFNLKSIHLKSIEIADTGSASPHPSCLPPIPIYRYLLFLYLNRQKGFLMTEIDSPKQTMSDALMASRYTLCEAYP